MKSTGNIRQPRSQGPSSSPAAVGQDDEALPSPPSPTFSSSSTAESGTSPSLPHLLPQPRINSRAFNLLSTPPSVRSTDTRYYTASWGSPYQTSSPYHDARSHITEPVQGNANQESTRELLVPSPSQQRLTGLSIHTPFLRPPPSAERVDEPVSASVLVNRARRPVRGLTEEWIRQHTENSDLGLERDNWLSDHQEDEHSSLESAFSDELEDWYMDEIEQRTPTLKSFIQKKVRTRAHPSLRGHARTNTITPNSFQSEMNHVKNMRETIIVTDFPSREFATDITGKNELEIPPPPPRKDSLKWQKSTRIVSNAKETADADGVHDVLLHSPNTTPRKIRVTTDTNSPMRLKKKIAWKDGRNIMVLLPRNAEYETRPLNAQDIENIQKKWQGLDYRLHGMISDPAETHELEMFGQSKAEWPDYRTIQEERQELYALGKFTVSLPDKKSWDAYVQELQEAKLRALGVSFGDEDSLLAVSLPPRTHRRVVTQYPSLPFVPTLGTIAPTHDASLLPSQFSGTAQSHSRNFARQSVSFVGPHSLYGQNHHQRSPSLWSPQATNFQPGHLAHASLSLAAPNTVASPRFASGLQEGYFPQPGVLTVQNELSQQSQARSQARTPVLVSLPKLQEVTEDKSEDHPLQKAAWNVPSSMNTDEELQKEIEAAENQLEEQMQNEWGQNVDSLREELEITRGNTMPYATYTGPVLDAQSAGLNVKAQEFKIDQPQPAPIARSDTFANNSFEYSAPAFDFSASLPLQPKAFGRSFGPVSMPQAIPGFAMPIFLPNNGDFNFSPSGPTFLPAPPPYPMVANDTCSSPHSQPQNASDTSNRTIFDHSASYGTNIVRQPKKSKALAIIKPSAKPRDDETVEGHDGRITQGTGRIKRVRGTAHDGDSVPLFATPTVAANLCDIQNTSSDRVPGTITTMNDKSRVNSENRTITRNTTPPGRPRTRSNSRESSPTERRPLPTWLLDSQKESGDFSTGSPLSMKSPSYFNILDGKANESSSVLPTPASDLDVHNTTESRPYRKDTSLSVLTGPFIPEFSEQVKDVAMLRNDKAEKQPIRSGIASAVVDNGIVNSSDTQHEELPKALTAKDGLDNFASSSMAAPKPFSLDGSMENEPSFEEIDAVMRHLNAAAPNELVDEENDVITTWHQPSPQRRLQLAKIEVQSPYQLLTTAHDTSAHSPESQDISLLRQGNDLDASGARKDVSTSDSLRPTLRARNRIHTPISNNSAPLSDWDDLVNPEDAQRFDIQANFCNKQVVKNIVAETLDPLSKTLEQIQLTLAQTLDTKQELSRRPRRVPIMDVAESDADDEDEEESTYPMANLHGARKSAELDRIISKALTSHMATIRPNQSDILQVLNELRPQITQLDRFDVHVDRMQDVLVKELDKRIPHSKGTQACGNDSKSTTAMQASIVALEERLSQQRIELSLLQQKAEMDNKARHEAENKLVEMQLAKVSIGEDLARLRAIIDEKDHRLEASEDSRNKIHLENALLQLSKKTQFDLETRLTSAESDLREALQNAQHHQVEAQYAKEAAKDATDELMKVKGTNERFRMTIEKIKLQMEESLHTRESMRGKLHNLQESMATAAQNMSAESVHRKKRETELLARQELLEARLQAESYTRERLEREVQRLEDGERSAMRATREFKVMEDIVASLRIKINDTELEASRYKAELEKAQEVGLVETKRACTSMQSEHDIAISQASAIRRTLEEQLIQAKNELNNIHITMDHASTRTKLMVEGVEDQKVKDITRLRQAHEDIMQDLKARHNRQLTDEMEDGHRNEQQLLERLSLEATRNEHLQERISFLEEKLELSRKLTTIAVEQADSDAPNMSLSQDILPAPDTMRISEQASLGSAGDGKTIQALRESIQVLQDQLQQSEKKADEMLSARSVKHEDEILWLRELLSMRKSDLEELISTIGDEQVLDHVKIRDAAVRLRASLQMEEQERQRALNGGSSVPGALIAAGFQSVTASPQVVDIVAPVAAAWDTFKTARSASYVKGQNIKDATPRQTPSRSTSFLAGLMTPTSTSSSSRFTADQLANRPVRPRLGRPAQSGTSTPNFMSFLSQSNRAPTTPLAKSVTPPVLRRSVTEVVQPTTPIMLRQSSYDRDASSLDLPDDDDFDEDVSGFFDDEE